MEKREKERNKKRLMVRYGIDKAEKTGFTKNLSENGIFIQTNRVFKPGTQLVIEVAFPAGSCTVRGLVVRANKVPAQYMSIMESGMGISLDDPTGEWLESLSAWLSAG